MRDVVVVGAGPVGVFLAALLAERGLDVAVWERRARPAFVARSIGVHPPVLEAFERIDATEEIVDASVTVRRGIARSGSRTLGSLSFDRVSRRFPFIASLPQSEAERVVQNRLEALAPGCMRPGVELRALEDIDPSRVRLNGRSADGDVFEVARFVVGADGARSAVRHLLGVKTLVKPYSDAFVMADFADDGADGDDAVIHVEPGGIVESFPVTGRRRRYVLRAAHSLARPTADTAAALVRERTGAPVEADERSAAHSFVPRLRLAEHVVHGRVCLVGDAAHELSPIGGQGMNLGWLDAAELAPLLATAIERDRIDPVALEEYETRRMRAVRRVVRRSEATMALARPVSGLRRVGRWAGLGLGLATPVSRVLASRYTTV